MSPFLLLCLPLAGATTWLPCLDGQPCPTTPALPASKTGASCPLPGGVTCAGGHRCCPRGSHCSADGESCGTSLAPLAIPCPDGQSECPDDATCCVTASGAWGCCPMPQASCCADKVHCCPHATICDLAHGRCLSPAGDDVPLGTTFPAWKRQPSVPVTLDQVLCPDGRSVCPDGSTCCQLPSARYGCCPLQNAVCCSDGQHCCPQGTTCDLEHSTCISARPQAALPKAPEVNCEDGTRCPDGNTCCRVSQGAWGCCPLEEAVCCRDYIHCCPRGSTCDPGSGICQLQGGGTQPWVSKLPALRQAGDVRCDEQTSCPDGSTCCRLGSGAWGCCPLEEAVCCPDHIHCCPRGSICNPEGSSCLLAAGGTQPWLRKLPALRQAGDVRCDEQTSCPDGSTCCRLGSGAWGCCPLEQVGEGPGLCAAGTNSTAAPAATPATRSPRAVRSCWHPPASCRHPAPHPPHLHPSAGHPRAPPRGCEPPAPVRMAPCPAMPPAPARGGRSAAGAGVAPGGAAPLPRAPAALMVATAAQEGPTALLGGWGAPPYAGTCLTPAGCCSDGPQGTPPGCQHPNKRFAGQTPSLAPWWGLGLGFFWGGGGGCAK